MGQRRCLYCQKLFNSSKFQPRQTVCSEPACQLRRRTDYHKQKIASDPEYRQDCRDSRRKWRVRHPDYWNQYRQKHPVSADRNRELQKLRDRKRKLCSLANNTSAQELKHSAAQVWLMDSGAAFLANNNSALAQVWVIKPLPPRPRRSAPSCKQQPAGLLAAPAA